MNNHQKGFTLMEMLIVVAIIAILVAVAMPVFSAQLEKAREATDLANVRSAYAEVMTAAYTGDESDPLYNTLNREYHKTVYLVQKIDGWTTKKPLVIGGISSDDGAHWKGDVMAQGRCEVAYNTDYDAVTLTWNGYTIRVDYQWKIQNGKLSMSAGSYNNSSWPCNAITESLLATNGKTQELTTGAITADSPSLMQGIREKYAYQIGYFITDEQNNIIVDSGRYSFSTTQENNFSLNVSDYVGKKMPYDGTPQYVYSESSLAEGKPIKIAVQVFKVNNEGRGSAVKLSLEEARELEKLISITLAGS